MGEEDEKNEVKPDVVLFNCRMVVKLRMYYHCSNVQRVTKRISQHVSESLPGYRRGTIVHTPHIPNLSPLRAGPSFMQSFG